MAVGSRWRRELAEPWGLLAAGVAGGLAAAIAATPLGVGAAAVGLGVAGCVYGVKVAVGVLTGREPGRPVTEFTRPAKGSPADQWLRRAEQAVRTLHDQTESPADQAVRERISDVDDQAAAMLDDLRRVASQVAAVDAAAARVDVRWLQAERARLADAIRRLPDGPLRDEQARAAGTVDEQLAVATRLADARDTLLARMQSTALGLEGLVARLAEVIALSATAGGVDTSAAGIAALGDDLEGMRAGLAETEALSRQALGTSARPLDARPRVTDVHRPASMGTTPPSAAPEKEEDRNG